MKNLETVNKISTLKEIQPDAVEDDFDPTEDGEASEKTHRASYEAQLGHQSHLQTSEMCFVHKNATFSSLSISS